MTEAKSADEPVTMAIDEKIVAKPVGSKIIVARIEGPKETKGGIVLPDTVAGEKSNHGIIVALDESWAPERPRRALKVNDRVCWGAYYGVEVTINDEQLFILDQGDVLAILEAAPEGGTT